MERINSSKRFLIIILVLSIGAYACGSSANPQISSTEQMETAVAQVALSFQQTAEAQGAPAGSGDQPTAEATEQGASESEFLGDAALNFGYALTAISVADPAEPGIFYSSEAGKKLVSLEIILSNLSGETLSANPLNATLVDGEGFVYDVELAGVDRQMNALSLSPGEQVRGWVGFQIPDGSVAASIKYSSNLFSDDMLQAGLQPPPDGHDPVTFSLIPNPPITRLGETVEQFGYSLSALSVENPAAPGILYTSLAGHKLVAVEITLANVAGSEELSANPLYAYLVDSAGFVYSAELGGRDGQLSALDLNTGERVNGWVSFTIPERSTPSHIKYQMDIFSDNFLITGLQ